MAPGVGSLWIVAPTSVDEVGCIHTCQGLELDYVGVIIGPDMSFHSGRVVTDATQRAPSDKSVRGLKQWLRTEPQAAAQAAERIVRNTYRTLITRGMKGCYVYCTDPALAAYLKSRIAPMSASAAEHPAAPSGDRSMHPDQPQAGATVVPLRRVSREERAVGISAAPLVELRLAAGVFSASQQFDEGDLEWVAPPDWVRPGPDLFVAQVVAESMNRRIPNGAWCLFRPNPQGSREGKVVMVEHRSIADPETSGRYTVKVYTSEKRAAEIGGWRHTRITLKPDTDRDGFEPIVIELDDDHEESAIRVVAEFLVVLEANG
jgi:hypothetical protein